MADLLSHLILVASRLGVGRAVRFYFGLWVLQNELLGEPVTQLRRAKRNISSTSYHMSERNMKSLTHLHTGLGPSNAAIDIKTKGENLLNKNLHSRD